MARWEGDAAGRLRTAAMEQFAAHGYEATTVADIAARAGLTARTFFRHYADKREVLFAGSAQLQERMEAALTDAPPGASPLDAVEAAVLASVDQVGVDRTWSRQRHALLAANAELRERELIKLVSLETALADALRRRGVDAAEADLAAGTGVVVFRQAFARWAGADDDLELPGVVRELFARVRALR